MYCTGVFVMAMFDQDALDAFTREVKTKYKGIVQGLNLELQEDGRGMYIRLLLIGIRRSQQGKGHGSEILSSIVRLADEQNVRVVLWPTGVFGADPARLRGFYRRHGFVLTGSGDMIHHPEKKKAGL
jgi:GNAT superfamily N-acetyltransferase